MEETEFRHYSVMASETLKLLSPKNDGIYVDCTFGGGGHTKRIFEQAPEARVIGIDRDEDAIRNGKKIFANNQRLTLVRDNFSNISSVLENLGIDKIDGAIMDLGVSSYQIDSPERGFSYQKESPLDMRMDRTSLLDGKTVANCYDAASLSRIFKDYGEERYSGRIAAAIVKARDEKTIATTGQLHDIVESAVFGSPKDKLNSVKRVFQAIRIEVNGELDAIGPAINDLADRLLPGGVIAVISFHSLEDRIVKNTFKKLEDPCECPRDLPICVCGKKPKLKIITKKPILPTDEENAENSRSHSAKLRAAERI